MSHYRICDWVLPILVIISRCILLLEDLDAAFTRSVTRDSTSTGTPTVPTKEAAAAETTDGSTLSFEWTIEQS